jgi:hypothetical protein
MTTDLVVRVLAVIGGGVGGGLSLGLLAQLLMRVVTLHKPPRWSLMVIRLLGGAIAGWLVALWLFGDGGLGIGGSGGMGFGSGAGNSAKEKTIATHEKDHQEKQSLTDHQTPDDETLRIEVLGNDALSEEDIRAERWYRIATNEGRQVLTFAEVKKTVEKRQHEQPPLRSIKIVLYKDSPDRRVKRVEQLKSWADARNDGKMRVETSTSNTDAPR